MKSTLYLMKNVDLDPNYNFTIDFDNVDAQLNYFNDKISHELDITEDYSYIKFNEPIKVYKKVDELLGVNYLMFDNNDKTYFAFILNKKWAGDNCTSIEFKIDVFQTFMFDYEIDETFIEREHQNRYGKLTNVYGYPIYNREKEQLERGDQFICKQIEKLHDDVNPVLYENFSSQIDSGKFNLFWVYVISREPLADKIRNKNNTELSANISVNKGMPTNTYGYVMPMISLNGAVNPFINFTTKLVDITKDAENQFDEYGCLTPALLKKLSEDTNVISINVSRYAPFEYMVEKYTKPSNPTEYNYRFIPILDDNLLDGIYLAKITHSDGSFNGAFNFQYFSKDIFSVLNIKSHNNQIRLAEINKNNLKNIKYEPKLNTNDYKYYELNFGNQNIKLNIEDFDKINTAQLKMIFSFSVKNGQAIIPLNYKGMEEAYSDMATFDSVVNELPLRTDAWNEYLAQNKNSLISGFKTNAIQTGLGLAVGIATGGVGFALAGMQVLNYGAQINNQLAQMKDIKATPDKVEKTTIDTTLDHAIDDIYIKINTYEIHDDFKMKLFNYFYHFGYKCNCFKKPNLRSRFYFNYIKTIGVNIKSNIDAEFKNEIKQIFDNGITIWHFREKESFKGVNNYDYENAEMEFIGGNNG